MNNKKQIIYIILIILGLGIISYFGYQFYLFQRYSYEKSDSLNVVTKGLKNSNEIVIYKYQIMDNNFLTVGNYRIRNDFKDYEKVNGVEDNLYEKVVEDQKYVINFGPNDIDSFEHKQLIDVFVSDASFFGLDQDVSKKFNAVDRKSFLKKNHIQNDIDFYQYVTKHPYLENHFFMKKDTLMENYAYNLFVDSVIPAVEGVTYIKGDYEGYIFHIGNNEVYQVSIIQDGKVYGFYTNDLRFSDENYVIGLIGTMEIF